MTNRERVNAILACCALFQRLASDAKRASRSKRPFVHIVATYGDMVICSIHP